MSIVEYEKSLVRKRQKKLKIHDDSSKVIKGDEGSSHLL